MRNQFRIREHRAEYVALSPKQVSSLQSNLTKEIKLTPTKTENEYQLNAGSHVGFVVLPEELTIVIEPKISISTIFYLLALVYDPTIDILREEEHTFTTIEELF